MSIDLQTVEGFVIIAAILIFDYFLRQEQKRLDILQDRVKLMENRTQYYEVYEGMTAKHERILAKNIEHDKIEDVD